MTTTRQAASRSVKAPRPAAPNWRTSRCQFVRDDNSFHLSRATTHTGSDIQTSHRPLASQFAKKLSGEYPVTGLLPTHAAQPFTSTSRQVWLNWADGQPQMNHTIRQPAEQAVWPCAAADPALRARRPAWSHTFFPL